LRLTYGRKLAELFDTGPFDLRRLTEAVEQHIDAFGRECTGDAQADPAGAAGNDSDLASKASPVARRTGMSVFMT
jgi:hypothetical protein